MAVERSQYDRYGLTGNPFRDLSSEGLDEVELFHVMQSVDRELMALVEEVSEKENKAVAALLGGLGAGKSERLMLIRSKAQGDGLFFCLSNVCAETRWVIKSVAEGILSEGTKGSAFSSSPWRKELSRVAKTAQKGYDPDAAGRAIASALNANAPAFLALNDLHWLDVGQDTDNFMHALHTVFDEIDRGVMVILTSSESYFETLMMGRDSLKARINAWLRVPPLSDDEAGLMIAKRLLVKRVVEDMQPLYPFSKEAVSIMNATASGNPRELLRVADTVIDHASKKKAIQIDGEFARVVISMDPHQEPQAGTAAQDSSGLTAAKA